MSCPTIDHLVNGGEAIPTVVRVALAILDSDISGEVRGRAHDVVTLYLTTEIKTITNRTMP